MQTDVRLAKIDDFDVVRRFDPHSQYIDPRKIKNKLEQGEILLAWERDEVVGMIRFGYLWSTRPILELIWVKPDKRKAGIGTKLLRKLEEILKDEGCVYLLNSSEKGEEGPRRWHLKQDFKECGVLSDINLPVSEKSERFYIKKLRVGKELKTYKV